MKKFLALLIGVVWILMSSGGIFAGALEDTKDISYTIPGLNDGETVAAFNRKLYNFTKNAIRSNGRIIFQAFEFTENDRVVAIRYDGKIRAWVIWGDYRMGLNGFKGNYVLFDKDCNGAYEIRIDSHESFIYPECYKK